MNVLLAALGGFLLDLLLGDPGWMPHPVVFMGRCITRLEKLLRSIFPRTPAGERWAGWVLAAVLPLGTLAFAGSCLWLCGQIHPALAFALSVLWCWQALAARGLASESNHVYRALTVGTLGEARQAVGRIVGRDTGVLTETGVSRAAVETVAENFSDGVVAPMIYMFLGGAPLALCYKAVNTMDSMVGYKNERYLHFGRGAAKLDDLANYLPARLAALVLVGTAFLMGEDGKTAFRIWRRDRRKHASPNSAQTEAAMAGALGIKLAGPASYFGKSVDKPWIGEELGETEPRHILRANRLMLGGSALCLLVLAGIRIIIMLTIGRNLGWR